VPYAIVLRCDAETCGYIDAMTACMPERLADDQNDGYPAHITLATFGGAVDPSDIDAALATALRWKPLPVMLARIGVSPGDPSIISLISAPTCDLLARHAALLRALADVPCHPDSEAGAWVPEVVVARTYLAADAVEVLGAAWTGPIAGWLDSLDLVQLDPIRMLSRRLLRP